MKRLMYVSLAICLILGLTALAGDKGAVKLTGIVTDPMCGKSGNKAKMMDADCAKKCAEHEGGKLAFVNLEDGTLWSIENSDAVKGHEGHQVEVNAHLNKEQGSIHVTKVSMTNDGNNKNDKAKKGESKKPSM